MARTIFVGDLHGCRDELERLLEHVGFGRSDRLIGVGDLVARGPDPHGTLELLQQLEARAVRGNHEDRLLRWRATRRGPKPLPLGRVHRETADELGKADWQWLARLPLWIDLPEHGVRVVHAGVLPGIPIEEQSPRTLMYIRTIGETGEANEQREGRELWAARYVGPPHLVFGHNALWQPQIHPWATGIDTGAVYGGRLTAMVLREGEQPPPPAHRCEVLVSVPAQRRYYGP